MRKIIPFLVFMSLLMPQSAPAAFAQTPKPQQTAAQLIGFQVSSAKILTALLQEVMKKVAFTASRRSGEGVATAKDSAELSEADAAKAGEVVMEALFSSLAALAGGFTTSANMLSRESRELVTAEALTPAQKAREVIGFAMPVLIKGFTENAFVSSVITKHRAESGAALALNAPNSAGQSSAYSFIRAAAPVAFAANPPQVDWGYIQAAIGRLLDDFSKVKLVIDRVFNTNEARVALPLISPLMIQYAARTQAALQGAFDGAEARDIAVVLVGLEAAGNLLREFMITGRMVDGFFRPAVHEFAGQEVYGEITRLRALVSYAAYDARLLQSGQVPSAPLKSILSDPREAALRAEQIIIEEFDKEIARLRIQQAATPTSDRASLLEDLERIRKSWSFVIPNIKEPMLSCTPVDTQQTFREIKKFSVREDVIPQLKAYAEKTIRDAEEAIRTHFAGKIPKWGIEDMIKRFKSDPRIIFLPIEVGGNYGDDVYPYRPKGGRLRWVPGEENNIPEGIFGGGYNAIAARIQQITMVGLYMAEDAVESFASDCTKPPSSIADELIKKLARYIDATSILSFEGASETLKKELQTIVEDYKDGLESLLRDLDATVYGGMASVLQNVATVNSSWTATAPDVTALLASLKSALAALDALGFKTAEWVDSAQLWAARNVSGGAQAQPPTEPKTLTTKCPTDPSPGVKCLPIKQAPAKYNDVCKFFGLPGYSIPPHPKPAYICSSGEAPSDSGADVTFVDGRPVVSVGGQPITTSGNIIYTGRCCVSPNCAYGSYPSGVDDYWNFIGITNGSGSAARRVNTCTMNLVTDPTTPVEQRSGCFAMQQTLNRGLDTLCGLSLSEGEMQPPPPPPGQGEQCVGGSPIETTKLAELVKRCATGTESDKASLAQVWEQAKQELRALFLKTLQDQMNNFPAHINDIVHLILRGELDKYTAAELDAIEKTDYAAKYKDFPAVSPSRRRAGDVAGVMNEHKRISEALDAFKINIKDFERYWNVEQRRGPNILAYNDPNENPDDVAKYVYSVVDRQIRNRFIPLGGTFISYLINKRPNIAITQMDILKAEAAAAGAGIVNLTYNIARNFSQNWGTEDIDPEKSPDHPASLRGVFAHAAAKTLSDAGAGYIFPAFEGIVVPIIPYLQSLLDDIFNPAKDPLKIMKQLYDAAIAIDRVTKELQDLSKKTVELRASVTACTSTIDTVDKMLGTLKALAVALEKAKEGSLPAAYGKTLGDITETTETVRGIRTGRAPETDLEKSFNGILKRAAQRGLKEAADALK